ncbi:MAG: NADH-quinone oxidoreductase subunit L [Gammaproteobacteria bacterium]|nr:NADH-quinone oxidoreductase subunit L [Gammaproteobacteria bacterium]MBU1978050.1 NADH-quinone oxidoreductase subunit L [Gammaproteobacteria bacterium]
MILNEIHWTQQAAYPILGMLQLVPLLGASLLLLLGERHIAVAIGRGIALIELLLAIDLFRGIKAASPAMQFAEKMVLLDPFTYHAAADGITVLFVLLTALVVLLLTIYSLVRGLAEPARLLAVILAVEAVLMSQLVTTNLLWFVLASLLELGLVGYLLWNWATSPEKDTMLARFYQFQGTGLLLLLMGTMLLGWFHAEATGGNWSFELADLRAVPIGGAVGSVVFFLLFYGMGIRTPIFPLHGWLPWVAQHGNVAIAPALLLGIKIGIYGLIRFVFPLVPGAVMQWHSFAVAFAAAGVFYAAFLAFLQSDLRRLMAFAVVSHTSLLIIGLFSLHAEGFQGSILLAVNFGLAMTVMLFIVGFVYRRTHTTVLDQLGGLFDRIPFIGVSFLLGGLAIVGMPGTPGFDAAHLVLEASIERLGALLTVAVALGNVAAAGFLLWAFQRAFLAPRNEESRFGTIERTLPMEYLVVGSAVLVLLIAGFYLEPWMKLIEAPLYELAERFEHP